MFLSHLDVSLSSPFSLSKINTNIPLGEDKIKNKKSTLLCGAKWSTRISAHSSSLSKRSASFYGETAGGCALGLKASRVAVSCS